MQCSNVAKRFGSTMAITDGMIAIRSGEVHALVGENGAGKSTLVKILSGVIERDSGQVTVGGAEAGLHFGVKWATLHGVRSVHQDQPVAGDLDVATSVFLGNEGLGTSRRLIDAEELRRRAREILTEQVGWPIDPRRLGRELTAAERVAVAIAGAFAGGGVRVLILDEPTAYLDATEARRLFGVVERVRDKGVGVLYISHFIGEIFELCDSVTIMRDGATVQSGASSNMTPNEVVRLMVGRDIHTVKGNALAGSAALQPVSTAGEPVCTMRNVTAGTRLVDMSLDVRGGEVLGIVGLAGSGIATISEILGGAGRKWEGQITIGGHSARLRSPERAFAEGVLYVPRDRTVRGLFAKLSTRENLVVRRLEDACTARVVQLRRERAIADDLVAGRRIHATSLEAMVASLSGGNQQKVLLARTLGIEGRICVLDEPTTGVDVGAREDIYGQIEAMRSDGMGVVVITGDTQEALRVGDRIVGLYRGRKVLDSASSTVSEGSVLAAITGVASTGEVGSVENGRETLEVQQQSGRLLQRAMAAAKGAIGKSRSRQAISLGLVVVLLALMGVRSPDFFTAGNWEAILGSGASGGVLSVALCLTLMVNGFDMSVGGVSQVASALFATTLPASVGAGIGIVVSSLFGLGMGLGFGLLSGLCVALLELPGFIVTLGVLFAALGLDLLVASSTGAVLAINEPGVFGWFGGQGVGGFSLSVVVLAVVIVALAAYVRWSRTGLRLRAWESGVGLLRVRGVPQLRLIVLCYAGSGVLAALSGISVAIYSGGASSADNSLSLLLSAAAGAFLGRTFTRNGGFGVGASFFGGLFVAAIQDGLILNGISSNAAPLVEGVVLFAAVMVGTLVRQRRAVYDMGQVTVI